MRYYTIKIFVLIKKMRLELKKFDISSIPSNSTIVLISRRNGGKTTCLKDIMYYHRDIPVGTVINPTESSNESYGAMIPGLYIHEEYSPKLIADLLKRQEIMVKRMNKQQTMYGRSTIDPRAFLILDDCMYDNIWKKDKNMRFVFSNGRHRKLFCIITLQYVIGIPPDMRNNVDYTFLFRDNNFGNRKKLYENYCSVIPTFEMFQSIMDSVTEGYGCLVINNLSRSAKLEDCIFWYEAEIRPDYTVGSKEYWQAHNDNAINNDDDNDGDEMYTPEVYNTNKKKNAPTLNIRKVTR